jgi:hypothetical protein
LSEGIADTLRSWWDSARVSRGARPCVEVDAGHSSAHAAGWAAGRRTDACAIDAREEDVGSWVGTKVFMLASEMRCILSSDVPSKAKNKQSCEQGVDVDGYHFDVWVIETFIAAACKSEYLVNVLMEKRQTGGQILFNIYIYNTTVST